MRALVGVVASTVGLGLAVVFAGAGAASGSSGAGKTPDGARAPQAAAVANPCAQRHRFSVYYATAAYSSPFYVPIKTGAENGARDFCLKMTWTQSQSSTYSLANTLARMKAGIAAKPDVLVVSMIDPQSEDALVRQAIKAGIAVINITNQDRRNAYQQPNYVSYIGITSDYAVGTAAATEVLNAKKPAHPVVAISASKNTVFQDRARGWTATMNAAGVTSDVVDVSKNPAGALKAYLVAHPNVDAIFTLGSGAKGSGMARQVIAELKRGSKISLVSTDYDSSDLKAIANGTQLAAITQEQYLQSYLAAAVTRVYFERGQVPAFISSGPRVVDKTNIKTVIANVAKGLR